MKTVRVVVNNSLEFELTLPWNGLPPIGTTVRIDARDSDGSHCVYMNVTGYDILADIDRKDHAKGSDTIIFADIAGGRSSHTYEELEKWLDLQPAE